jgi:hypothetical protein
MGSIHVKKNSGQKYCATVPLIYDLLRQELDFIEFRNRATL